MSPKFLGVVLLAVLAAGYVAWQQSPSESAVPAYTAVPAQLPATGPETDSPMASVEGRLAAIEQRLQRLEQAGRLETVEDKGQVETGELRQRVEALEVQLRRMPSGSGDEWAAAPATRWETRAYDPQEETSAGLKAVREAFENDNNADQAWQEELENAAPLFDAEELGSLEFRQIDCRASYCRLMYDDNSAGGAEAEMAENELLILLAKKYGQDIVVYGGERKDRSKTVYLKLPQE